MEKLYYANVWKHAHLSDTPYPHYCYGLNFLMLAYWLKHKLKGHWIWKHSFES